MDFAVLGPVVVRRDGQELPLGGPKQRAVLAMLLLHANEVVSRDALIDGIWGERPPPTAAHTLDNYVSRLRKALGDGRLARQAPGYALRVEPDELDLDRFERLLGEGRSRLAKGMAEEAAATLRAALALWRGPAVADLLYEPFARDEAERIEERRLNAFEARIEAELALGSGAELVPELEALVSEHPQRERLVAQLMLALYGCGRQAEALAVFDATRRRLAGELGLEPGPELRKLQRKILEHDPSLAAPRTERTSVLRKRSSGRLRLVAAGIVAAAVAASVVVGALLGTRGTRASNTAQGSSALVGLKLASGKPVKAVPLGTLPAAMVAGHGSLWLASPSTGTIVRVDPAIGAAVDRIPVGANPGVLSVGGGSVWAASVPGDRIFRIDPETGTISQTIPLGSARAGALAFAGDTLWVGDVVGNALLGLAGRSGEVRRRLALDFRPTALAVGTRAIWGVDYGTGTVAQLDPRSGQTVATIRVGNGPSALAVAGGHVWVANALDSTVSEVDPRSDTVVATLPVGSGPTAVAAAGGRVWVANQYSPFVSRIDPKSRVVRAFDLGSASSTLAAADGKVWVGTELPAQHRGGTLVLLHTRPISIDPALQVDLLPGVSDALTRDGLVTFNQIPGPAGTRLVPDLAISIPVPTDGGTTYTFRLRPGIRYSDGRPVRAADFRRALERVFRLGSEGRALFAGILGAERCNASVCDLRNGIVTDEAARTVTFHLRAPDPDFMRNLTEHGLATPVPSTTPFHDVGFDPIPATGPYKIAQASDREIRLVRNPFFREWSHAARPDGNPDAIVLRFGLSPAHEVRAIVAGRADWMADNPPPRLMQPLTRRFPSRLHSAPEPPTTDFLQFNTTLPPFDDVRVRRAFNLAIDRRAVVRIYGGSKLASATCQPLPEGLLGFRPYCPYTRSPSPTGIWRAPDFTRARRLVDASGTRGTPITVWGWTDDPTIRPAVARYAATVLQQLGYPTRVRLASHSVLPVPLSEIQLIPGSWGDTTDGFLTTWFSCTGASDHGWFCDHRIDRQLARARALRATNPRLAAAIWARVDHELVDQAAWVPLIDDRAIDFVSARVRNYRSHPYWGILADQLWLR